jgi:flagellar motor switch protein FliN/FliY
MTNPSAGAERPESAEFVQAWVGSFSQVLAQITGSPVPCAPLTEAAAAAVSAPEGNLWLAGSCSGGLRGDIAFRLNSTSAVTLARMFLGEPASSDAQLTAEHGDAVVELLRQVAGLVATTLQPRWGKVQLRLERAAGAASWPAASTWWLRCGAEDPASPVVELWLSAALAAGVRAEQPAAPAAAAAVSPPAAPAASEGAGKLDLLMDVELAVTLRFGGRRLLLREVLELAPGAVLELDREVQEPVEVLLGNRLVARGEVVVVDGNYGLRIREVAAAGVI